MVKRKPPKKGKPQAYDAWTPEYTAKGELTRRSKKQLEAIRAQAIGEGLSDDIEAYIDLVGYIGLVAMFYYGINPFLYSVLASLAQITAAGGKLWDISIGALEGGGEAILKIFGHDQEEAKKTAEQIAAEIAKDKQRQLDLKYEQRNAWQTTLNELYLLQAQGPEHPSMPYWEKIGHNIETLEKALEGLEKGITKLESELAGSDITPADKRRAQRKADMLNLLFSCGEAGFVFWFAKSYDMHKAVENLQFTG